MIVYAKHQLEYLLYWSYIYLLDIKIGVNLNFGGHSACVGQLDLHY